MDMRPFELANNACKPKHFAPPTALQRRLRREEAYFPASGERRIAVVARGAALVWRWLRFVRGHQAACDSWRGPS
ncbi:MAG TPA: hypothetical protein VFT99_15765 [Roseiflexaceae bacterium]|nr:hypothetical protein [Roseiflexaceae bacterium]